MLQNNLCAEKLKYLFLVNDTIASKINHLNKPRINTKITILNFVRKVLCVLKKHNPSLLCHHFTTDNRLLFKLCTQVLLIYIPNVSARWFYQLYLLHCYNTLLMHLTFACFVQVQVHIFCKS